MMMPLKYSNGNTLIHTHPAIFPESNKSSIQCPFPHWILKKIVIFVADYSCILDTVMHKTPNVDSHSASDNCSPGGACHGHPRPVLHCYIVINVLQSDTKPPDARNLKHLI